MYIFQTLFKINSFLIVKNHCHRSRLRRCRVSFNRFLFYFCILSSNARFVSLILLLTFNIFSIHFHSRIMESASPTAFSPSSRQRSPSKESIDLSSSEEDTSAMESIDSSSSEESSAAMESLDSSSEEDNAAIESLDSSSSEEEDDPAMESLDSSSSEEDNLAIKSLDSSSEEEHTAIESLDSSSEEEHTAIESLDSSSEEEHTAIESLDSPSSEESSPVKEDPPPPILVTEEEFLKRYMEVKARQSERPVDTFVPSNRTFFVPSFPGETASSIFYDEEIQRNVLGGVHIPPRYFPHRLRWFEPYKCFYFRTDLPEDDEDLEILHRVNKIIELLEIACANDTVMDTIPVSVCVCVWLTI